MGERGEFLITGTTCDYSIIPCMSLTETVSIWRLINKLYQRLYFLLILYWVISLAAVKPCHRWYLPGLKSWKRRWWERNDVGDKRGTAVSWLMVTFGQWSNVGSEFESSYKAVTPQLDSQVIEHDRCNSTWENVGSLKSQFGVVLKNESRTFLNKTSPSPSNLPSHLSAAAILLHAGFWIAYRVFLAWCRNSKEK